MDVTSSVKLFGNAPKIADEIRWRVKKEMGVTVSVGVSWNKIFAKLGSDMRKPDATTILTKENFKDIAWILPASELLYVGPATTQKLKNRGIYTIGDIAQAKPAYLKTFLHTPGEMLWYFANGYDTSPVAFKEAEAFIKSVGNSTTCPRDLTNNEEVQLVFYVLAESVGSRLRENGLEAKTVKIHVRDCDLYSFERQMKLDRSSNVADDLVESGMKLFIKNYTWEKPIRSIGIRGADLVPTKVETQLSLFADEDKRIKLQRKEEAVDYIRSRFGYFSLHRAVMLSDRSLSNLDAKTDHTIHPVGYNYRR